MKAVVAAFNQEKALVGAFSVITNLRMQLFEALVRMLYSRSHLHLVLAVGAVVVAPAVPSVVLGLGPGVGAAAAAGAGVAPPVS